MKIPPLFPAAFFLSLLLTACAKDDRLDTLASTVEQQNKTIMDQQQSLLDQQQKLMNQEIALSVLAGKLDNDEDALKKLQDQLAANGPAPDQAPANVDPHKMEVVRDLAGFNARLSSNIGYDAYADSLGDLNANLATAMLDVKDQTFIDSVNRIRNLYNSAGEFWGRFSADGVAEISLTSTERYKYADLGVNFLDGYNPRPSDVKKFWLCASDEIEQLVETNSTDLGRDGTTVVRLFGH
jgi:hypothetical protein